MIQNAGKIETSKNIIIHKITERIEYYKILKITDDEGEIYLLKNIKYTVIVAYPGSPIRNTPHSMSLVFCETIVGDPQYKTEAATYHYL